MIEIILKVVQHLMVILIAFPIFFGVLLGLLRGSRRALLRLILIILCVVLAFVLCGPLTNKVLTEDIIQNEDTGEMISIEEMCIKMLGKDMEAIGEFTVDTIRSFFKVLTFLALLCASWFISWLIVFPICQIFVKPKQVRDSSGRLIKKKRRLLGALFGLIQGIAVALVVCIVFNGFYAIGDDVIAIYGGITEISNRTGGAETVALVEDGDSVEDGAETSSNGNSDSPNFLDSLDKIIVEYRQSIYSKLFDKIGTKPFELISKVESSDGRTVTLSGQVKALRGIVDIAEEFVKLTELDMQHIYEPDSIALVKSILTNVQNIRREMSDETKGTVDKLIATMSDAMGINLNFLSKIDIMNVENEGKALETLGRLAQEDWSTKTEAEIKESAKELIEDLGNSELLIDVLDELLGDQNLDITESLGEEMTEQIDNAFDELVADGTLTQEKVDKLRNLLGMNKQNGEYNSIPSEISMEYRYGYAM